MPVDSLDLSKAKASLIDVKSLCCKKALGMTIDKNSKDSPIKANLDKFDFQSIILLLGNKNTIGKSSKIKKPTSVKKLPILVLINTS